MPQIFSKYSCRESEPYLKLHYRFDLSWAKLIFFGMSIAKLFFKWTLPQNFSKYSCRESNPYLKLHYRFDLSWARLIFLGWVWKNFSSIRHWLKNWSDLFGWKCEISVLGIMIVSTERLKTWAKLYITSLVSKNLRL